MKFTFGMYDYGEGDGDYRAVNVEGQAETVPEVLELFLSFMQGSGYKYVNQMVAVYDNGKEVETTL
jgi:hypothetical protein